MRDGAHARSRGGGGGWPLSPGLPARKEQPDPVATPPRADGVGSRSTVATVASKREPRRRVELDVRGHPGRHQQHVGLVHFADQPDLGHVHDRDDRRAGADLVADG